MIRRLALVGSLWLALAAATPLPVKPPPPDLTPLVPWATAPLAKPAVEVPRLTPPPPPLSIAPVSPATVVIPAAPKPMAPMLSPRAMPCVGAWLRIASESLECARARIVRGEYEEAARALDNALRAGGDREILAEARYWFGEVLYLLGDFGRADWALQQALKDLAVPEYGPWARHASGWTSLRLGDFRRAEANFQALLGKPHPVPLDTWGRHGLALALYAQARWEDAEKAWSALLGRRVPVVLERDLAFWHGEALARTGQTERAVAKLQAFTQSGPHALLPAGQVRLGWLYLGQNRTTDAQAMFRAFLAGSGDARGDREWAEAGLALALVNGGDSDGARRALAALDARRSTLALPIRLRLAALAQETGRNAEALATLQEVLAGNISPAVRAWVLVVQGDVHRAQNEHDEARTQFDLARTAQPGSETAHYATFRLAHTNFELREFAQAAVDLRPLLLTVTSPDMRVAALLLAGEAAYHAGNYTEAADAYRRALLEFPSHAQAPAVRLALAWTALRQGQRDAALQEFLTFTRNYARDGRAADALVLASELALAGGNFDLARELLDRIISLYPTHPRTDLARLNRALLQVRRGQAEAAQQELKAWVGRGGNLAAFAGRAWVVLGVAHLASNRGAEASQAFTRAYSEGGGALARLGQGNAALLQNRWDDATRAFTEARDTGTSDITAAAEYALLVVSFHRGRTAEFKAAALSLVEANHRDPRAPGLLYALVGLAIDEKDWATALARTKRLAAEFPKHETADDACERVGAAAVAAAQWPVAHEAYVLLRQRFPQSPFVESSKVTYGEVLLELGRASEARRVLEEFVAATPTDPRAPRAWIALGRARTATGDRKGAVEAFDRATKGGMNPAVNSDAFSSYGRLLLAERRWEEARTVLGRLLASTEGPAAAEVAAALGDAWMGQGDPVTAAEYYMTAAYLTPESTVGYKALLAAGRSFAAAKDPGAASVVYGKLLASSDVPGDIAASARRGLAELRR
ncbi:MAG TPA: tetratricopeptide repeat protein [Methylomirabilota bacterium]